MYMQMRARTKACLCGPEIMTDMRANLQELRFPRCSSEPRPDSPGNSQTVQSLFWQQRRLPLTFLQRLPVPDSSTLVGYIVSMNIQPNDLFSFFFFSPSSLRAQMLWKSFMNSAFTRPSLPPTLACARQTRGKTSAFLCCFELFFLCICVNGAFVARDTDEACVLHANS